MLCGDSWGFLQGAVSPNPRKFREASFCVFFAKTFNNWPDNCNGSRLYSRAVTPNIFNVYTDQSKSFIELLNRFNNLAINHTEKLIASQLASLQSDTELGVA